MRRILLICMSLLSLAALRAQGRGDSFLELSAGAGWSTLTYSLSGLPDGLSGSQSGSYGLSFHLGYGVMLGRHVGLGLGAGLSRFGATASLGGAMRWSDVTDTDGERYNHIASVNRWADRQELYYIQVPLTLYLLFPTRSRVSVSAEIGLRYAYPLLRNARFDAEVSHSGEYPDWGMTVVDMPNHGFCATALRGSTSLTARHELFAFAKLGVAVPIARRVDLFAHVYADCGLFPAVSVSSDPQPLGLRDDTPEAADLYYFMPAASSLLLTGLPSGKFLPVQVGLELGLRFRFSAPSHSYPCRCLIDD